MLFSVLSISKIDKTLSAFNIKPVNVFSDIQRNEKPAIVKKVHLQPDSLRVKYPSGIVGIDNFSDKRYPLESFFNKLKSARRQQAKVRIAWFGDSFTDADLVVSDLRDTLQSVYGGNGVGFVPMTSEAPGFRQTVLHSFYGWKTSSVVSPKGMRNFGINGYVYQPDSANYVQYSGTRKFRHTRRFDNFSLFYQSKAPFEVRVTLNDTIKENIMLAESALPSVFKMKQTGISKVKIRIPYNPGVSVFGASLEDDTGIYIDNFSIKGNSGIGLLAIPAANIAAFDSLLNYDLIVLQYGLNAVTSSTRKYDGYMLSMKKIIHKLRKAFPDVPILMLSVSDRSERLNGEYITMKSIDGLVQAQKAFASENKLLFWNLFEAMGGENSMAAFVAANPPLANKDYTHLNFKGGRKIGLSLAKTFIYEQKRYDEKQ
jgi:lysophospholipase L1-like esterase